MPAVQFVSLLVNRSRRKLAPPSSERRSRQPAPITTLYESIARALARFCVVPVARPRQLAPPSSVRSSVPKSPTAYPRWPANSIAFKVWPCGCGLPQFQPDCPTVTSAAATVTQAATISSAAAAASASLLMVQVPSVMTRSGKDVLRDVLSAAQNPGRPEELRRWFVKRAYLMTAIVSPVLIEPPS